MSHTSRIFEQAPIQVPKRNGFDLSHLHIGSSLCGQLKPCLCKLLPPNTDFTLGVAMNVELPALSSAFFGRIDAIVEGFVVPLSILYGGFKKFISNNPATGPNPGFNFVLPTWDPIECASYKAAENEYWPASYDLAQDYMDNGSLLDALGFCIANDRSWFPTMNPGNVDSKPISLLPFLAYHLVWSCWYRNPNVTRDPFDINDNAGAVSLLDSDSVSHGVEDGFYTKNVGLIWHSFYGASGSIISGHFTGLIDKAISDSDSTSIVNYSNGDLVFPDGVAVWQTRQRNYSRDYFTSASTDPQQGNAAGVKFTVSAGEGEFTIAALRAANALQVYAERNNLSFSYRENMRNRWGCDPIDADFEEPYYLGRVVVPVYQKSVYQQDSSAREGATNPFAAQGAIGVKGAHGSFVGEGSITDRFHVSCWSYVFCNFSLVPHAMYAEGIDRELFYTTLGDFPTPELQTLGYEEIWSGELFYQADETPDNTTYGYIPRYSVFKYCNDRISGELRAGRTLDSFALQRFVGAAPQLSTSFLEIGVGDLDDVFAVSTSNMHLSCWYEIFFAFKAVMPLSVFAVPTLGDLKDTKTITTRVSGSKL